ncbi:hypothetical protein GGTG_12977 [Gaeumannomyces tritici R3-111a-1]|uniref:Uncharacterized protein n=1 Tax=Gaeumannomyces tritici (strain R3-111a-1) TaxID=644352 RepID=J3PHJ7_GAET3|nr:hypothetical protein GGTG_12977 [Gaeumannomyces tritici R3-111a-1]EJT69358.1 hypothetical protein GGTG_12977 [Gaeumannomyces tritici R3-111a-1]
MLMLLLLLLLLPLLPLAIAYASGSSPPSIYRPIMSSIPGNGMGLLEKKKI